MLKRGDENPLDVWHTVLAQQENSILLEGKEGPLVPDEAKELALWAPQDGSAEVNGILGRCREFSESKVSLF